MRKTNKSKKDQAKKLPQLQKLHLEQLEWVAGGPNDTCPACPLQDQNPPVHCPDCERE